MATRNENPAPFMAVHPGMMIKPELEERGITQKDFAKMLGVQASHLSEVLNGKRALTTDLAVKIEGAIGLCRQSSSVFFSNGEKSPGSSGISAPLRCKRPPSLPKGSMPEVSS